MSANFEFVNFTTDVKSYRQAGDIFRDENVLGYHICNTGGCIVFINNFPLYPSGVLDTMLIGYKDKSKYTIRFDTSVIPIPNPEITVITFSKA
jgi:hypothetical protein